MFRLVKTSLTADKLISSVGRTGGCNSIALCGRIRRSLSAFWPVFNAADS